MADGQEVACIQRGQGDEPIDFKVVVRLQRMWLCRFRPPTCQNDNKDVFTKIMD
jgi:hypothetical protein